ncbi:MAG TPA: adenylate/guanylate cyclase domain-containing protein [Gemmatimonadota bacterium]
MSSDRRLATILFTDIVGSTERAAELGDRGWRELLQRHHAVIRAELQRYGGSELTTTGDGFLAAFDRPEQAIRCACAARDAVERLGIRIRAGLHTGEVERVEKTVGGIAVHVGARIAALAAPGEVLVSGALRDIVAGSGFGFEERGVHALKGVPGEWRLYAVTSAPFLLPVAGRWERVRQARLPKVVGLYLLAGVGLLWLTKFLSGRFGLPAWVLPLAVLLLGIGLVILVATALVQSRPAAPGGDRTAPGSWDLDLADAGRSLMSGRVPHLTWSRSILGGVVAFALLFGLAGTYVIVKDRGRTFAPSEAVAGGAAPGIAVLPFTVRGQGLDVWREGMVDVLSTNLDGPGGFRSIDSRTVLARWRERVPGDVAPDLPTSLDVARAADARYALVGNAITTGSDVRFSAEIYDVRTGENVGRGEAVGSPDSILPLVNKLSIEVLRALLRGTEAEVPWLDVATLTTSSVPALKAYLQGEALYRQADFESAVAAYREAVAADSLFALALYRLGDAYGWLEAVNSELAHEFTERAARTADRLPEREARLLEGLQAFDRGTLEAVPLLQEVVRRYPDDAEAWFLLGDTYFHLGLQALVDAGAESDRALRRAVELDPGFAPYYLHLIDLAIGRGDSAAAAGLLEKYAGLAPRGSSVPAYRTVLAVAFGDSAAVAGAVGALGSLERAQAPLWSVGRNGRRPRELLASLAALRANAGAGSGIAYVFFGAHLGGGWPAGALARLDDPLLSPGARASAAFRLHEGGFPVPEAAIEAMLTPSDDDSTDAYLTFYTGAYAADRGRWPDHAHAVARLRTQGRRSLAAADSAGWRLAEGQARALEGFGLWRKGDRDAALGLLKPVQRQLTGYGPPEVLNAVVRWWLGELLLEMDRPREAEPYFRSLTPEVGYTALAARRLGALHEGVGEPAKARADYELVARAWEHADPALQPVVQEARAAAARLGGSATR